MRRTQRTRLTHLAMYAVLIGVVAVLAAIADWEAIKTNFLDADTWKSLWPDVITTAAINTIKYTAIAFAGGLALALVLALMKLSPVAGYRWLATAYIEFFRGLPALVVILFMALGVPLAFGWSPPGGPIGGGLIALIMVSSAYMAETLRAGIQAVPKGQEEASRSLGMSGARTMVSVTLPQAVRIVIPPLTNEFVLLLKDTSLLSIVGLQASQVDLTAFGSNALNSKANPSPLLAVALVYLAIALPLTRLVAYLESRTKRAR
jgi:polar amino acid transport system permease protein